MGVVYLIHFQESYRHARHYLGFVHSPGGLQKRLANHRAARLETWVRHRQSKLMAAVGTAGIGWELARTWENKTIEDERRMHRAGKNTQLCPICNPKEEAVA